MPAISVNDPKRKIVIALFILLVLPAFCVHAQQYNSESDFEWEMSDDNRAVTITKYIGTDTDVRIPPTIQDVPVTVIGKEAFEKYVFDKSDAVKIKSVVIPDSVVLIDDSAFSGNSLTNVEIPASVTRIGDWAFYRNGLESVIIPNSVTDIGERAFCNNALTGIEIPNSITIIQSSTFSLNNLTSVTIPDSVVLIDDSAFSSNSLTTVEIPASVTRIGNGAFYKNILTSVIIPNSVTTIGWNAFLSNRLESIVIPNSVTEIGTSAFSNNMLTSVEIPNSITHIKSGTFSQNKLTSVIIPDSVTEINSGAFTHNLLTEVTIPSTIRFPIAAFDQDVTIKKRRSNGEIYEDKYPVNFNFVYSYLDHRNAIMGSFPSEDNGISISYYFTADVFKYNIMHTGTNIGIFLSPLRYTYTSPQTQMLSFINPTLYFNLLNDKTGAYNEVENIFGPFFSISWLNIYNFNEFNVTDIVYSAGLLFSYRIFTYGSGYGMKGIKRGTKVSTRFTLEAGYTNINGKNNLYAGIQISEPMTVFIYLFMVLFRYYP